jgi:hypothetical protein
MKKISGYIFSVILLLGLLRGTAAQDTLRTYGPRIGIDLARIPWYFTEPPEYGAEISLDAELFRGLYPVLELGYSTLSLDSVSYNYRSGGPYLRAGTDYNFLSFADRTEHHSITVGFRLGLARFSHRAGAITLPGNYWGEYPPENYSNDLTGSWLELVGGLNSEIVPNFFLGWSVRYRILLNPGMDARVPPRLVPGYGNGTENRGFGISYRVMYKIPVLKK